MPRFYCDYCDAYLTHDSAPGRQQHMRGWKHRENFKKHYEKFYPQFVQNSIQMQNQMQNQMQASHMQAQLQLQAAGIFVGGMPPIHGVMPPIPGDVYTIYLVFSLFKIMEISTIGALPSHGMIPGPFIPPGGMYIQ